jgi:prepilin-type N-terminal cleavage/methylation domain-containing protein
LEPAPKRCILEGTVSRLAGGATPSALPPVPATARRSRGYTLIELITVMVLIGVMSSLAVPSLRGTIELTRVRSGLDRVTADLYYARMLAASEGVTVDVQFFHARGRCVSHYEIRRRQPRSIYKTTRLGPELLGLCLTHSGDDDLAFNARGMLIPPGKSMFIRYAGRADSVIISIAGRVRRTY